MLLLCKTPLKKRYANLLLSLSNSFNDEKKHRIDLKLTREDVASIIGATPETVTRVTSEFKKHNIIEIKNKYFSIKDLSTLKNIAEGPQF